MAGIRGTLDQDSRSKEPVANDKGEPSPNRASEVSGPLWTASEDWQVVASGIDRNMCDTRPGHRRRIDAGRSGHSLGAIVAHLRRHVHCVVDLATLVIAASPTLLVVKRYPL